MKPDSVRLRRRMTAGAALGGVLALTGATGAYAQEGLQAQPQTAAPVSPGQSAARPASEVREVEQVQVTVASTANLIGGAVTSSQGRILKEELDLRPVYRVGQLLETVPGLNVTAHSGEGKANQYLLRGFNLDHGHDLATTIDEMPVNMRTHAHGQGYTDLNFFVPELAGGVDFTKGPYYAAEGDYSAVGAVHIRYLDQIPNQVTLSAGTVGDERLFAAGTYGLGTDDRLLAGGEVVHLNGPWDHPDNFRKENAVLRYSHGDAEDGYSLTGMYYRGLWNATTDQPSRAIASGLIGRFGTLDPSDGGQSERFSLSGRYTRGTDKWRVTANAFAVRSQLTLWNDFTHYLDDPVNGDQHAQNDRRTIAGGALSYTLFANAMGRESDTVVGVQGRYDHIYVDLRHTKRRVGLSTDIADRVNESSGGAYAQNTTYWTNWLRSIVGVREDYFHFQDDNLTGGITGSGHQSLFQPKASLAFGPFASTEFYVSAGEGYHSNDIRAGTAVDVVSGNTILARPPLLVKAKGGEVGFRTTLIPHVQAAVTLFQTDFDSELTYDADAGQTDAGRPSRRRGVEFTGQYRPFRWLELSANLAVTRARYRDHDPAGRHIEDAPSFVGSLGALVDDLGPWFGALEYRDLGAHPLVEDNTITSPGYRELNLNLGYKITPKIKVQADIYNLFNSKDDAADYYYTSRLQGEPAGGVDDLHIHPLEPRSARFSISAVF